VDCAGVEGWFLLDEGEVGAVEAGVEGGDWDPGGAEGECTGGGVVEAAEETCGGVSYWIWEEMEEETEEGLIYL